MFFEGFTVIFWAVDGLLLLGGAGLLLLARARRSRNATWGGAFLIGLPALIVGVGLFVLWWL